MNSIDQAKFQTLVEVVKARLQTRNYFITKENDIRKGRQIRLSTGSIVNVMQSGKIILQGKSDHLIKEILGFLKN